jgi:lathosterol oxidase
MPQPPKGWNYVPELPVQVSPFFRRPWRPAEMLLWLWRGWFPISERLLILGIALISWIGFQPSLEATAELEAGWVMGIWLRNLVLMTVVAGGLHLWLFTLAKQGTQLKHDARPLKAASRSFTFGNQVRDNMFWTLASGVTVWTGYEVLLFWAMSNGYAPMLTWAANPVWFILLLLLIPVWESFYFYWIHRLLHLPVLYRLFHALHHRNTNVGPWSGLSMHPVEHLIYLGSVLIHFVVAAHPVHILYHLQYFTLSAATTHSGFAGLAAGGRKLMGLGTFHHQIHHRYFECNYGSLSMPWDVLFGTFHNGTRESHEAIRAHRRKMVDLAISD